MNIHQAAKNLLSEIKAPPGAVNTLAQAPVIRVLIESDFWLSVRDIPSEFEGFKVVVEKRQPSVAFH
jgi:hypothetical protein